MENQSGWSDLTLCLHGYYLESGNPGRQGWVRCQVNYVFTPCTKFIEVEPCELQSLFVGVSGNAKKMNKRRYSDCIKEAYTPSARESCTPFARDRCNSFSVGHCPNDPNNFVT